MSELTVLDPDEVLADEIDYAALTTADAKKILCSTLNESVIERNNRTFMVHREQRKLWLEGIAPYPSEPFYLKDYNLRRIDQAVFTARQRGGFDDLLEAAGYRPHKKR